MSQSDKMKERIFKANNRRERLWREGAFNYIMAKCGFYDRVTGDVANYSSNCIGYRDCDGNWICWEDPYKLIEFAWEYKDFPDLKWRIYQKFIDENR